MFSSMSVSVRPHAVAGALVVADQGDKKGSRGGACSHAYGGASYRLGVPAVWHAGFA